MSRYIAGVFGASGLVGSKLTERLLEDPHCEKVKVFVRKEYSFRHPKLEVIQTDFMNPASLGDRLKADRFFCCIGSTIRQAGSKDAFRSIDRDLVVKLARLCLQLGLRHWSVISSMGASLKSPIFYLRTKAEMENSLLNLPFLSLHILRPSFLLGRRPVWRPGEYLAAAILTKVQRFLPLRYRPIEAEKLAEAMLAASSMELWGKIVIESEALQCGKEITKLLDEDSSRQSL